MSERVIVIDSLERVYRAIAVTKHLPVDGSMDVVFREHTEQRTPAQNSFMWGPTITTIAAQARVRGLRYSAKAWHENFKREYLPEGNEPDIALLVTNHKTYRKWEDLPNGERVLVGSTKRLTTRGFSEYVFKIESWAAQELGVMFGATPQQQRTYQ